MIGTYVHLLAWVYGLGFVAAAPVGPVNMVAINRGVMGKWTHTLACGFGSALVDTFVFAMVLVGGQALIRALENQAFQDALAVAGVVVLFPLGLRFLVRAVRHDHQAFQEKRNNLRNRPPIHLWTDVGTGIALTVINPMVPLYWTVSGAAWLARAHMDPGSHVIWWSPAAVGAGLMTWFCVLTALVRFVPNRLGPTFFRTVNGICGVMLMGFGVFCAVTVISRHLPTMG
jgi:threonine/homoserine/homoserine lactone efflux protein